MLFWYKDFKNNDKILQVWLLCLCLHSPKLCFNLRAIL